MIRKLDELGKLNFVFVLLADVPKFGQPINNVTIPVALEATLACVVEDLATYKVKLVFFIKVPLNSVFQSFRLGSLLFPRQYSLHNINILKLDCD